MLSEEGPVFRNRPLFRTFLASGSACNFRGSSPRTAAMPTIVEGRLAGLPPVDSANPVVLAKYDRSGLHCRNGRSCSPI